MIRKDMVNNMALKFYKCSICGNIVCMINDSGNPLTCCGKQMVELKPGMTDGAVEKHVPVCSTVNDTAFVKVGEEPHPMTDMHHIEFIAIETNLGIHIRYVWNEEDKDETCKAKCCFKLCIGEEVIAAYAYCNLHGMFKCDCVAVSDESDHKHACEV